MDDAYLEEVLRLVEAVPPGCVTTYGDLAEMVGRAGPRQVGTVLARHGAGVPWWRVVRADGRPADGLVERALRRLAAEGVPVRDGRVRMASARWRPPPEEFPTSRALCQAEPKQPRAAGAASHVGSQGELHGAGNRQVVQR